MTSNQKSDVKVIPLLLAIAIGCLIWVVLPTPTGVKPQAWGLFALFAATIAAIIGKALPIGAIGVISIALVATTGVTNESTGGAIADALSGFANPLIWLIGFSIMISRGLIKTGLGARIGYLFISLFGQKTLGIGYALSLSELVLAPVTPSNTARGGGIIHPIMKSIATSFGSNPDEGTQGRIGRYLALVNYHANPITSAMFITATAPNPLIVKLIAEATGSQVSLSWGTWAWAMLLPGLACLLVMPLAISLIYPPEIKVTENARTFARQKMDELGPIKRDELILLSAFVVLLVLWADLPAALFGHAYTVNPTTAAAIGVAYLLLMNVLTWDNVLSEKAAWDTIVWFSALVMMATFLNKLGLIAWFSDELQAGIRSLGLEWPAATTLLVLVYMYAHYLFASTTAHITAMFAAFYIAGIAAGAPAFGLALIMAAVSSLMMTLTHYATGTSPIIFGSRYTTLGQWWFAGLLMSIINLTIWIIVGVFWWQLIGYV